MPKFEKSKGYKMKGFSGFKPSPAKQSTGANEEPSVMDRFMAMGKTLGNSKVSKSTIVNKDKTDLSANYTHKKLSDDALKADQAESAKRVVGKKVKKMGEAAFLTELGLEGYEEDPNDITKDYKPRKHIPGDRLGFKR